MAVVLKRCCAADASAACHRRLEGLTQCCLVAVCFFLEQTICRCFWLHASAQTMAAGWGWLLSSQRRCQPSDRPVLPYQGTIMSAGAPDPGPGGLGGGGRQAAAQVRFLLPALVPANHSQHLLISALHSDWLCTFLHALQPHCAWLFLYVHEQTVELTQSLMLCWV